MKPIRLLCCNPVAHTHTQTRLEDMGLNICERADIVLLYDSRCGQVGQAIRQISSAHHWIVVTHNPCPEYLHNLWEVGVAGLLSSVYTYSDIASAVRAVSNGERFHLTPSYSSLLTSAERRTLAQVAFGASNKEVARALSLEEGTVKSSLNRINDKLGLENRQQLSFYYLGLWHLLPAPYCNRFTLNLEQLEPQVHLQAADD